MRSVYLLTILVLISAILISAQRPPAPTPSTATTTARTRLPNGRFGPAPLIPVAPKFERKPGSVSPGEQAANKAAKLETKAEQRAASPEQQRISEQNRVNDIAKTLQRGNKQGTAKQIFDLQEQRRVKTDQISKLNKIVTDRNPNTLIPLSDNPATAVKMNSIDKMNIADKLKGWGEYESLVRNQKSDIDRVKYLNDQAIKGGTSKEWLTNEARAVQTRENSRMTKIRDFLQAESDVLNRQAEALSKANNNHNSPLQQEADFDEATVEQEESVNEYDFDAAQEKTVVAPKQMFRERRSNKSNKVHVNVEIDA